MQDSQLSLNVVLHVSACHINMLLNQMIQYRQGGVIILNWSEMGSQGVVRLIYL